jgi:hypothetical protein
MILLVNFRVNLLKGLKEHFCFSNQSVDRFLWNLHKYNKQNLKAKDSDALKTYRIF